MKTRKHFLGVIAASLAAALLSVSAFADIAIEDWTDCYGADITSFATGAESDVLKVTYTNAADNLDWTDIGFKICHTDWNTEVWVDAYSAGTAGEQTFSITLADLLVLAEDKAGTALGEILWIDVRSYSGDVLTSVVIEAAPADDTGEDIAPPAVDDALITAPAVDETTQTGDTDVATEGSSKDNSDTGVEDVAAVLGLAIVAAGVVAVSRKRK